MSIKFKQVAHTYGQDTPFSFQALEDVNLEIEPHKITAIIGATGSGKSTLVQHLNALLLPTHGEVTIEDKVIVANEKPKQLKALREKVGLVFQFSEAQLFEETILKDVMFGPKNFGKSEEEATILAKEALTLVGIEEDYYDQSPLELSGGQKRRVAIAGVIASNPSILVLDEPTAGLDPQGTLAMMQLFLDLNKERSTTILLVTHDMDHVLRYADNVVVMDKGKMIYHNDKYSLFENAQLLNDLGLVVPKVIAMRDALIEKGIRLSKQIYTLEELVEAVFKEVTHG
ncbi:MAG: energy-coupling factor transporter ATPase [Erysipelothrix sp.]|nr:energy-coupling factor transporter ATPase [Erysipelothrix sp.]